MSRVWLRLQIAAMASKLVSGRVLKWYLFYFSFLLVVVKAVVLEGFSVVFLEFVDF